MQPATLHVAPPPPPPPPPPGLLWPKLKIAPLLIPLWIFQLLRACRPAPCPNLLESWKKLWSRRRKRRRRRRLWLFIINPSPRSKEGSSFSRMRKPIMRANQMQVFLWFFKPYFYVWILDWGAGMQTNYARQFGLIEGCSSAPRFYLRDLGLKNTYYEKYGQSFRSVMWSLTNYIECEDYLDFRTKNLKGQRPSKWFFSVTSSLHVWVDHYIAHPGHLICFRILFSWVIQFLKFIQSSTPPHHISQTGFSFGFWPLLAGPLDPLALFIWTQFLFNFFVVSTVLTVQVGRRLE